MEEKYTYKIIVRCISVSNISIQMTQSNKVMVWVNVEM